MHFELCATEGDTPLVMDHYGVPDDFEEHIAGGWHAQYWDPMRKFLAANS